MISPQKFNPYRPVASKTSSGINADLIGSAAVCRPATAFVDIGAGATIIQQLEPRRTGALEGAGSIVADAETKASSAVLVEALAFVDVVTGAATVDRFLVPVVAGALEGSPGVDALVLASVIRKLTLVDIATISSVTG